MSCHVCGKDAVDRCYACGRLFCPAHGNVNCSTCEHGIVEGDPSPERVSATRSKPAMTSAWWRPQPAEEYHPPSCYVCGGLTRAVCRGCGQHYCAEHAGRNFSCSSCAASTDVSMAIAVVVIGMMAMIGAAVWWFGSP